MTKFLDGLAAGQVLLLQRAPLYLRALYSKARGFDACDQLDDQPLADETVVAYRRVTVPMRAHIDFSRGRKGPRSGWYEGADYRMVTPQPSDARMRSTSSWQAWCQSQLETDRGASQRDLDAGGQA